jgi:predicted AAA+ superfamily ATPase
MKRDIYNHLEAWKVTKQRKPLIVRGARQVGKTFIIKEFARNEYADFVYLNFEDDPALDAMFANRFDKQKMVNNLSTYGNITVKPQSTLIILDEIQASDAALQSLKSFKENANEYHVIAVGSLLGIKLARQKSFPVGQVNFLDLYPLSFTEFLDAMGKSALRDLIDKTDGGFEPLPEPFHRELTELLKEYYITGGMPEPVAAYCDTHNFHVVRKVQKEIIDSYLLDFSKHADKHEIAKISLLWQSIPLHLSKENKKFIFSAVQNSARARDYEGALQWLVDAGLIYKSYSLSTPEIPLKAFADTNVFKVFLVDVGLLGALAGLPVETVFQGTTLFTYFYGAFVENYVVQQLRLKFPGDFFYWTSPGKAEVDFVIQADGNVYPLEAKAGINLKSKSLSVYNDKYKPDVLSRTSLQNFSATGQFRNYPLYALSQFPISGKKDVV